jgi:hypothetical protein
MVLIVPPGHGCGRLPERPSGFHDPGCKPPRESYRDTDGHIEDLVPQNYFRPIRSRILETPHDLQKPGLPPGEKLRAGARETNREARSEKPLVAAQNVASYPSPDKI